MLIGQDVEASTQELQDLDLPHDAFIRHENSDFLAFSNVRYGVVAGQVGIPGQ
jgi:hypothetical protein